MRDRERAPSPNVRAHTWPMVGSIVALLIGSVTCGNGAATSEQQDESPGAGGSAGSDVASGNAGDGSPSGTGGSEQASDGGLPGATGGNAGASNGGGSGGSGAKGGSGGAGGSGGGASSVPCGTVVYDGEGAKTNLASGATFVWPDGGTLAEVTGEAHGGLHSMKVVFTPQGGWAWNWGHWVDKTSRC